MADYTDNVFVSSAVMLYPYAVNNQGSIDYNTNIIIDPSDTPPVPPGPTIEYLNRVSDSVAGKFVSWVTTGIDDTGASYPGPGTFGVDTSGFTYSIIPG